MGEGDLDQDNVVVVGHWVVAIGGGGIEEGIGVKDGMDEGERGQEEIDTSPILKEGVKSLGDEGHTGPVGSGNCPEGDRTPDEGDVALEEEDRSPEKWHQPLDEGHWEADEGRGRQESGRGARASGTGPGRKRSSSGRGTPGFG